MALACGLVLTPPAQAQLGLPPVVPEVPNVGDVLGQTRDLGETLNRPLEDVRRLRVRDLLRTHRRELEPDPDGHPIVRSQIIAVGMSETAQQQAEASGFEVVRRDALGEGLAMVTLRAPRGLSTRRALRRLREADPQGTYDFDHLHLEGGDARGPPALAQAGGGGAGPRIGLIDSGVGNAPVVASRGFATERPVAGAHGAVIAELLSRAAPGARIYAADIYGGAPTGGSSSTLTRALAWMADENVPVINVSLVGPRNRVVEAVVSRLVGRGFVIVAAVGNDGPAAPPLYPASYDGVVGVTGVDTNDRVLVEAGRGAQVDFAARGVHGRSRGTSFAAPLVSGLLAAQMSAPSSARAQSAVAALRAQARDLGARGRDNTYGYGLVPSP